MTRPRRTRPSIRLAAGASAALVTLALLPGTAPARASAAPARAGTAAEEPTTRDDTMNLSWFDTKSASVLRNDADPLHPAPQEYPSGYYLEICYATTVGDDGGLEVEITEAYEDRSTALIPAKLWVTANHTPPGTYRIVYWACNRSEDVVNLTPGTLTVTVTSAPRLRFSRVAGRRDQVRVLNPTGLRLHVRWGRDHDSFYVPARGATRVRVNPRKAYPFVARRSNTGLTVDRGTVRVSALRAQGTP